MINTISIIGITVVVSIITIVIVFYVYKSTYKKWKCTENGCVTDINGDYTTQETCVKSCSLVSKQLPVFDSWACSSNNECLKAIGGQYTSKEACQSNCYNTNTLYYPQSLFTYNRPYYWSPPNRRRHHRQR